MASIREVAKRANVGVATVSRVINETGYVSEETRQKISRAIEELDYTPNELARNLSKKKSNIVAVLVPTIENPFFSEFVKHAESMLHAHGFKTMLCNAAIDGAEEKEYLDMLNRNIVDGIITGVHTLSTEEYTKIKKPIVALDRFLGTNIPIVSTNHVLGGRMAAELFVKGNCKSVIHFTGSTAVDSPYHSRHSEFEKMMKINNIQTHIFVMDWNQFDIDYYSRFVKETLQNDIYFDGVFGVDFLAIACINELRNAGKNIPEDIMVVSYDGTYVTDIVTPRLTSIQQPIDKLAKESVDLIVSMIKGKHYKNKQVFIDPHLKPGASNRD